MKKILLLGAGKSASYLIKYLLEHASSDGFQLVVADQSLEAAKIKTGGHPDAAIFALDANNDSDRRKLIETADLVISMLPAFMHLNVAKDCLDFSKNLITASYVSSEMKQLHAEAEQKGLLFLNEMGLDPGIDHMSAMKIIHEAEQNGGKIISFKSYCGGLVAPESNDNPWGYKFSWNPRNVILAGQGTAHYLENGKMKYKPYNRLFAETDIIRVNPQMEFDGYANRDSTGYIYDYGLKDVQTLIRGTLRQKGFCAAWQVFVSLGITDDTYQLAFEPGTTYRQFTESFLPEGRGDCLERLMQLPGVLNTPETRQMIESTGICSDTALKTLKGSPALVLQQLLEEKWKLMPEDLDMIVMQHMFEVRFPSGDKKISSTLVLKGTDHIYTAMARTVGLPLAIGARHLLKGTWKLKGIHIPVLPEIYLPVLRELAELGIVFEEKEN